MINNLNIKPDIDKAAFVAPGAVIIGDVALGDGASVWYGTIIRGEHGTIRIGKKTNIQDGTIIHTKDGGRVDIADNVTIGHKCIIHGCAINEGCLIGMGAIILNNAVIGKNCVVAAGSLVTEGKEFPEGSMIMGSPAKVVRPLKKEEIEYNYSVIDLYQEESRIFAEAFAATNSATNH